MFGRPHTCRDKRLRALLLTYVVGLNGCVDEVGSGCKGGEGARRGADNGCERENGREHEEEGKDAGGEDHEGVGEEGGGA